jgi:hypothetical protein
MHNVERLAADLAPFFKKGGNNGYHGDGSCKRLNLRDSAVTTGRGRVSPVSPRVVTSPELSGDAKSEVSQPLSEDVTTVTTRFECSAANTPPANYPAEWYAILEELKRSELPLGSSAQRWGDVVADAANFLSSWGEAAGQLGWTTLDLFGVHPAAPRVRFDVMGLIPMLRGRTVSSLTKDSAVLRCPSGASLVYRRQPNSQTVLLTEYLTDDLFSASA